MIKIYCLFDVRNKTPRYIGTTKLLLYDRLIQHLNGSSKGNTKKDQWIRSVGKDNIGIRFISDCFPDERQETEREYIQLYSNFDLVNTALLESEKGSLKEYLRKGKNGRNVKM